MAYDVFISYAADDKATADFLCETLENGGLKCWIAPRNIVGNYGAAIIKGIKGSKMMVLVLSSGANQSRFVQREVERAADKGITIYTVRIEDVRPSENLELFVSTDQWFDAFTSPLEKRREELVANVKLNLGQGNAHLRPVLSGRSWLIKLKDAIRPSRVVMAAGGLILLLLAWNIIARITSPVNTNANVVITPTPVVTPTPRQTTETASGNQRPNPTATPAAVASVPPLQPTQAPTPTPASEVVESLVGTLWEYRHGSSVRYIWDFQPGGRFRSRRMDNVTFLPDGTWEQNGDTVIIRTSITTNYPETYKGKIQGDRMEGTFTGLDVYSWSATKRQPLN